MLYGRRSIHASAALPGLRPGGGRTSGLPFFVRVVVWCGVLEQTGRVPSWLRLSPTPALWHGPPRAWPYWRGGERLVKVAWNVDAVEGSDKLTSIDLERSAR